LRVSPLWHGVELLRKRGGGVSWHKARLDAVTPTRSGTFSKHFETEND
jgi:hypothetical protein